MHEDLKTDKNIFDIFLELKKSLSTKNKKEYSFPEIYKNKALVSKQIFSKIFCGLNISKDTMLKFVFAFECSIEEAEKLLKYAGYAFSPCIKRDLILKNCLENKITDILNINEILKKEGLSSLPLKKNEMDKKQNNQK